MDARRAVPAGPPCRQKVSAWLAALAVLALAAPAAAAPKAGPAKVAFDRGVAAYQKGNFAAASDALEDSFKLEADVETLYAWAQSERQLERCEKAIELFEKLLQYDMPAENKKVVRGKIDECKALLPEKQPPKQPEPEPEPEPAPQPEAGRSDPPAAGPTSVDRGSPGGTPWWKDPLGGALVGAGVVGLAAGVYFLGSARGAEQDSQQPGLDFEAFKALDDRAQSHGRIGLISLVAGGALVTGGIVRYVTRGSREERTMVTGFLSTSGGGLTAMGRF